MITEIIEMDAPPCSCDVPRGGETRWLSWHGLICRNLHTDVRSFEGFRVVPCFEGAGYHLLPMEAVAP